MVLFWQEKSDSKVVAAKQKGATSWSPLAVACFPSEPRPSCEREVATVVLCSGSQPLRLAAVIFRLHRSLGEIKMFVSASRLRPCQEDQIQHLERLRKGHRTQRPKQRRSQPTVPAAAGLLKLSFYQHGQEVTTLFGFTWSDWS